MLHWRLVLLSPLETLALRVKKGSDHNTAGQRGYCHLAENRETSRLKVCICNDMPTLSLALGRKAQIPEVPEEILLALSCCLLQFAARMIGA